MTKTIEQMHAELPEWLREKLKTSQGDFVKGLHLVELIRDAFWRDIDHNHRPSAQFALQQILETMEITPTDSFECAAIKVLHRRYGPLDPVADEREAIAQLVEGWYPEAGHSLSALAAQIRSRK
jgi:hypothetical protein